MIKTAIASALVAAVACAPPAPAETYRGVTIAPWQRLKDLGGKAAKVLRLLSKIGDAIERLETIWERLQLLSRKRQSARLAEV